MSINKLMGCVYETLVQNTYTKEGYRVLARNVRVNHTEFDLIVLKNHVVVFVEVKYRSSKSIDVLVGGKRPHSVREAMATYLSEYYKMDWGYSFELIAVTREGRSISFEKSVDYCSF